VHWAGAALREWLARAPLRPSAAELEAVCSVLEFLYLPGQRPCADLRTRFGAGGPRGPGGDWVYTAAGRPSAVEAAVRGWADAAVAAALQGGGGGSPAEVGAAVGLGRGGPCKGVARVCHWGMGSRKSGRQRAWRACVWPPLLTWPAAPLAAAVPHTPRRAALGAAGGRTVARGLARQPAGRGGGCRAGGCSGGRGGGGCRAGGWARGGAAVR
jgi:hypothetical protein